MCLVLILWILSNFVCVCSIFYMHILPQSHFQKTNKREFNVLRCKYGHCQKQGGERALERYAGMYDGAGRLVWQCLVPTPCSGKTFSRFVRPFLGASIHSATGMTIWPQPLATTIGNHWPPPPLWTPFGPLFCLPACLHLKRKGTSII